MYQEFKSLVSPRICAIAGIGVAITALCLVSELALLPDAAHAQSSVASAPPPAEMSSSVDETAWRLFIYAMSPTGNPAPDGRLNWESWVDQDCLYQSATTPGCPAPGQTVGHSRPPSVRFHHSVLQAAHAAGTMNPPDFEHHGCKLSLANRMICEEARLNPVAARYVSTQDLEDRAVQAKVAFKPGIAFARQAVETKVDWLQYSGTCASAGNLSGVYTEELVENGKTNCYALAGIHLNSKLLPNWLWVTFEPQNSFTNPQRCVVLGCRDSFGSNPAVNPPGHPIATQMTERLKKLMVDAKLDPVFQNYRLDGVQTTFVSKDRKPTLLGNSIIEGENGRIPLEHASCITCHAVSSISRNGTDGITLLKGNPIGEPPPLAPTFQPRDFVWSLFLAPAQNASARSRNNRLN